MLFAGIRQMMSELDLEFIEFNPVYTPKQTMARRALARDDIKEVLYGLSLIHISEPTRPY